MADAAAYSVLNLAQWFLLELFVAKLAQVFEIPLLGGEVRIIGNRRLPVFLPWPIWHLASLDEAPMDFVPGLEAEVVADGG